MSGIATSAHPRTVTRLLHKAQAGDREAADELFRNIEKELRKIAAIHMRRERPNHTLQTTAVMNEAVIRLLGSREQLWMDRQHFLAAASRVMRRFLVDYARAARARKREGVIVSLDSAEAVTNPFPVEVLDVHRALDDFAAVAPRQAQLVELRYFGGLSLDEAAEVVGISQRTADKDWALAKAWLHRRLGENQRADPIAAKSAS